ncbi:MAG TPA: hypothetical protein VET90_00935, partial [Candidatus Binatus sp.]|nr:hypothetical protein [Candidatus Binatus sp.]
GEVSRPGPADPSASEGDPVEVDRPARRAEAAGGLVALGTAVLLVGLGGVLGLTTGLVFVAGVGGALIGLVLAGSPRPRRTLRIVAIGLAVATVLVGAVGGWLIALAEGGSLGLFEYLWAMTGVLVPVELIVAALAASWGVGAGPIRP